MSQRFYASKISQIIAIALLASFVFPEIVLAQTTTPADEIIPGLNTEGWNKAQADKDYCLGEFKKNISFYTNQQFKTVYDSNIYPTGLVIDYQRCYIVTSDAPDTLADAYQGVGNGTKYRPYGVVTLETEIKSLPKGILKSAFLEDANKAANQQVDASLFSQMVGWALNGLASIIASVLSIVTGLAAKILSIAADQAVSVTTMPAVVTIGWTLVRDISNMFFILILIVIALAAILRIESYDYKHLLGELIIMAILVNFSKVIAVAIMNLFNVVAAVFYKGGLSDIVSYMWGVINPGQDASAIFQNGWQAGLTLGLGKIVFMVVGAVVFIALAAMFVIRLVGLYVLIIFSPIAYVSRILPATHHYSEEWWSHFMKYLIWAPVALFMLWLARMTVATIGSFPGKNDSSFFYFIISAFLFAALLVAEEAGMVGSKAITGMAEKGLHAAGHFAGHAVTGYAGRKWNDFTSHAIGAIDKEKGATLRQKALFSVLNPVASMKGRMERAHEKQHIASTYALATGKEIWGGRAGTPYREFLAREEEMKYSKEYLNMSKEQKAVAAKQLEGVKGHEAEVRRRSLVRAAIEDHHVEDIMASANFVERYTDDEGNISREATYRFMRDFLGADHDRESQRFIASDVNTLGAKVKRFDYTGMALFDAETGAYKAGFKDSGRTKIVDGKVINIMEDNGPDGQAAYAANEMSKMEAQDRAKLSPQNFTTIHTEVTTDANGKRVVDQKFIFKADAYGQAVVKNLDEGVRNNINRTQARMVNALVPGKVVDKNTIEVQTAEEAQAIKELWQTNREHAKTMIAKKMGSQKADQDAGHIHGINIQIKGEVRNPDGSTHVMRVENEVLRDSGVNGAFDNEITVKGNGAPAPAPEPTQPEGEEEDQSALD